MASIGEYGLDINSGAIASPNIAEDFMSYCGPRWMSIFTNNFLTNIAQLSPQVIPSGSGTAAPRMIEDEAMNFERDERIIEPLIHILGVIGVDGEIEVKSVARLETRYLRGNGRQTGFVAQLLDGDRVIAEDNVFGYESEGGTAKTPASSPDRRGHGKRRCAECGGDDREPQPVLFKALLRDAAPGTTLRIVKRGEVVWERRGADKPPRFNGASATLNDGGDLCLEWKLEGTATKGANIWVRWSNDDGTTWHALTVDQRGGSATIAAEQLPSGSVRFELLANDGFHTVRTTTDPVALPAKPPAVTILYPGPRARVYGDRLIHLWGTVSSFSSAAIDADGAEWFIDDKPAGKGLDIWVENPGAGGHQVRLQATDAGITGAATNEIEVLGERDVSFPG